MLQPQTAHNSSSIHNRSRSRTITVHTIAPTAKYSDLLTCDLFRTQQRKVLIAPTSSRSVRRHSYGNLTCGEQAHSLPLAPHLSQSFHKIRHCLLRVPVITVIVNLD